jgi:hypothetical protein
MIRLNLKIICVINGFSDESIAKALAFGFINPMVCLRAQKLRIENATGGISSSFRI